MLNIFFTDIVYYISLLTCIYIGSYYNSIDDLDTKKNYGTGLGMLIAWFVCGNKIYHSILMVGGNIIIIKYCDKSYLHQLSISFTWLYVAYLNFNLEIKGTPYQFWIYQAIALRLVGLAFEIHFVEKTKNEVTKSQLSSSQKLSTGYSENVSLEPSVIDIITYAYYFIGLHKGPYYRWKVFQDHFTASFGVSGNFTEITEQKLMKALAFATIFLILRSNFPFQMYYKDSFYKTLGAEYRYLYNIPHLVIYALQQQILMILCTSVCTESGFGIYPARCLSLPGHGPSTQMSLLKLATEKNEAIYELDYNFATLKSFDNENTILGPRMRDTIRGWDMTTRYWFWSNTYKDIIGFQKEIRQRRPGTSVFQ